MADLFDTATDTEAKTTRPLADRLRPTTLGEVIGQQAVLGPDGPLGAMLAEDLLGQGADTVLMHLYQS